MAGGVVAYLQRANIPLLQVNNPGVPVDERDSTAPKPLRPGVVALVVMAVLVVFTPLGLLAPGGAFGEDAPEDLDLGNLGLNAIPTGLAKYTGFWNHTLLGDYGFSDGSHLALAYVLSAVVGILVVGLAVYLIVLAVNSIGSRDGKQRDSEQQIAAPDTSATTNA